MMRCGKTGKVLLYGTACARCDCGGAVLELDGVTSKEQAERIARRARGFETRDDAGDAFAYMTAAFMAGAKRDRDARIRERQGIDPITEALMGEGFYPSGGVYERARRERQPVEIITDPADQRGLAARHARVPR